MSVFKISMMNFANEKISSAGQRQLTTQTSRMMIEMMQSSKTGYSRGG